MSRFSTNTKPGKSVSSFFTQQTLDSFWKRPSDWLTLPTVSAGEQKIVGLYPVYQNSINMVAFSVSGAYIVDWGDATPVEYYSAGATAQHIYNWSDVSSSTYSTQGYRQAVITVTMQTNETMTSVNFHLRHSIDGARTAASTPYGSGWLEIFMAGASVNTLLLGSSAYPGTTAWNSPTGMLQRFTYVGTNLITNASYLFNRCYSLSRVDMDMLNVTTTNNMFFSCTNLKSVNLTNTQNVTDFSRTFDSCYTLKYVSSFSTASATNMSGMFASCASLEAVPFIDASKATNLSSMFAGCTLLKSVSMNAPVATTTSSMFSGCSALKYVELTTSTTLTDVSSMFLNCISLEDAPLFTTTSVTTFVSAFENCYSLKTVPVYDMSSVTAMNNCFRNCSSLTYIPAITLRSGANLQYAFFQAYNLSAVDIDTTIAVLDLQGLVNAHSLGSFPNFRSIAGTSTGGGTVDVRNLKLSETELNSIFRRLLGSGTINISGNPGTASCDRSIATSRGWTVSG